MSWLPAIEPELLARARAGELDALDVLLHAVQPAVYNLAVRMLGHREDARDATQEILLKVVTHLGSFRGEAQFGTWVWQVARRHLLDATTRAREAPTVSLDSLSEELRTGLAITANQGVRPTDPLERAQAREIAVTCTQGMLMRLDRGHRLAYLLDTVFGLPAVQAAQIMEIAPAAYRKRLSRARQTLESFAGGVCGVVNPLAPCRCERQVHALQAVEAGPHQRPPSARLRLAPAERAQAEQALDELEGFSSLAGVLRAHPDYQAPEALIGAIRAVLQGGGAVPPLNASGVWN